MDGIAAEEYDRTYGDRELVGTHLHLLPRRRAAHAGRVAGGGRGIPADHGAAGGDVTRHRPGSRRRRRFSGTIAAIVVAIALLNAGSWGA